MVAALSGGIDSVALLHALVRRQTAAPHDSELSALHVHHGISAQADRWEGFCSEYCRKLKVPFASVRVAVERAAPDGLEAAARRARHAAFAAVDAEWILLAHHRDDQAETLLFNLLRGAGVAGAAAMRERNGRLLRPLLTVGRGAIENYAQCHQLSWCEDESNADSRHSRNFLRNEILPALTRRFPAARKNLAAAAARFGEAQDLLNDLARNDLGAVAAGFPLNLEQLRTMEEARARNMLRYLLNQSGVQIPSEMRLRETLRQMLDAAPDRHPAVVFGRHRLLRRRGWLHLEALA